MQSMMVVDRPLSNAQSNGAKLSAIRDYKGGIEGPRGAIKDTTSLHLHRIALFAAYRLPESRSARPTSGDLVARQNAPVSR